ncbi:MAG: DUF1127 domain-containing protein [Geminicoccaceae bacterium]
MKNQNCIDTITSTTVAPSFGLPPWTRRVLHVFTRWCERSRQRRQLAALNDAALKDIGLTRSDVRIETKKPFWSP